MGHLFLHEIPAAYRAWSDRVEAADGELSPELEADLAAIEDDLATRADAYVVLIREAEAEDAALRAEIKHLMVRAVGRANLAERLKRSLLRTMESLRVVRVHGPMFRVAVVPNAAPTIRWPFAGEPPDGFRRVRVDLDGAAAHAAHKAGTLPAGFEVETGSHLRIS